MKQPSSFTEQLAPLRQQIDELDTELVQLLAKRLAVTKQIGQLKAQAGVAIYDPEREQQLIHEKRQLALNHHLSPELVEDILRRMMRDSYLSQDDHGYKAAHQDHRNVVVIGGKGQLGSIFVQLFRRSGYQVNIVEQHDWALADDYFINSKLVLVAVPINHTRAVIQRLTQLPADCILADITSIKDSPLYEMMKVHQGPVVGLHPMFGPDISNLIKQTIIVCHGRDDEQCIWLLEQFRLWGAKIYPVTAQNHDKAMSLVQVMRHFSTIAYGYHLMMEGAEIEALVEMSSPIYRLELAMVGRLFAQDPILYTDIIFANHDNIAMMRRYAYRFLELLEDVELKDKQEFITMFNQVAQWFGDYADIFLHESSAMLQKTNELKS